MGADKHILTLAALFTASLTLSLFVGRLLFPPWGVSQLDYTILTYVRLPRVVASSLAGAALGVAGVTFQNVFRNYLAGPGILGVTGGAAFGAAIAILLLPPAPLVVQLTSFAFGLLAMLIAYRLAKLVGGDILSLVLAGIVVSAMFSALVGIVKYLADPYNKLPTIVYWLLGSFSGIRWCDLMPALPPMTAGVLALMLLRWVLNVLSLNDEEARSLGLNVGRFRMACIVSATMAASAATSVAGMIAWVGIVAPHIARLLVGFDNRRLVPASALVGATLLLLCDDIARSVSAMELPLSVVTNFLGAPTLMIILARRRRLYAGS